MKRDLLLSFSFANLAFFRPWEFALRAGSGYYKPSAAADVLLVSSMVALVAIMIWLIVYLARRSTSARIVNATRIFFSVVASAWLLPYGFVLLFGKLGVMGRVGLALTTCLAVFALTRPQVFRLASVFLLCLSPFILVTYGQAALVLVQTRNSPRPCVSKADRAPAGARVLWVIFDELDENLAFETRPESLQLEEFDALKASSWSATRAYPPANFTELSIPSLFTGRLIEDVKPINNHELLLHFLGDKHLAPWSKQSSVLTDTKELGFRTALVGFYHPYCNVLGGDLDYCFQTKYCCFDTVIRDTPSKSIGSLLKTAFPIGAWIPGLGDEQRDLRFRSLHLAGFKATEAAALNAIDRFENGLLILHLPIPHPPAIYDRSSDRFSVEADNSYLDNLLLADHALGEIRKGMQRRGMWEDTTVLVTSDHWWRVRHWSKLQELTEEEIPFASEAWHRIPFIVKLPKETKPATYDSAFNTVVTRRLILSLLKGDIKTEEELSRNIGLLTQQSESIAPFYRDYDTGKGKLTAEK